MGDTPPDVDNAEQLQGFYNFIQAANQQGLLLAYHDRSDGGLITTLAEMAFTARCGLNNTLPYEAHDAQSALFNEELGARHSDRSKSIHKRLPHSHPNTVSPS